MKKAFSLVLAVLFVFTSLAMAEEDFTGTWYCTEIRESGISIAPGNWGMEVTLTLNGDGTAVLDFSGESSELNWAVENGTVVLSANGSSLAFVLEENSLILEEDGSLMKFERSAEEPFTRPAEVYAENITAFDGTWVPVEFGLGDWYLDMNEGAELLTAIGLDMGEDTSFMFVIENGVMEIFGTSVTFSLTDGLLFAEYSTGEGSEPGSYRVQLLEGDMISVEITELSLCFYCARAVAVEQAA